jgi:hypothetical protein
VLPSPFRYDALRRLLGEWGLTAPAKAAAPVMSFAVPDVADLVAPPSVEAVVPEPTAALVAMGEMEAGGPIPIPISLVHPVMDTMHDEPTVDHRSPSAEVAIPDELLAEQPTAEAPSAEQPIVDEPVAQAPLAVASEPPPAPPQSAPQGDWLLAHPSDDSARDGFAGLDFGSSIDIALDTALCATDSCNVVVDLNGH